MSLLKLRILNSKRLFNSRLMLKELRSILKFSSSNKLNKRLSKKSKLKLPKKLSRRPMPKRLNNKSKLPSLCKLQYNSPFLMPIRSLKNQLNSLCTKRSITDTKSRLTPFKMALLTCLILWPLQVVRKLTKLR